MSAVFMVENLLSNNYVLIPLFTLASRIRFLGNLHLMSSHFLYIGYWILRMAERFLVIT